MSPHVVTSPCTHKFKCDWLSQIVRLCHKLPNAADSQSSLSCSPVIENVSSHFLPLFLARGIASKRQPSPVAKINDACIICRKQYHVCICLQFILIHSNTDVVSLFRVIVVKHPNRVRLTTQLFNHQPKALPLVGVILKVVALELNKLVKAKLAKCLSLARVLPASPCQVLLTISQ